MLRNTLPHFKIHHFAVQARYCTRKLQPYVYIIENDPIFDLKYRDAFLHEEANVLGWTHKDGDCVNVGEVIGAFEIGLGALVLNPVAAIDGKFRSEIKNRDTFSVREPAFVIDPVLKEEESCLSCNNNTTPKN